MARLVGEVVVVEWDENDEPVEIAIDSDGERYLVAHNAQFDELVRYVGHEVEVEGRIEDEDGEEPVIRVQNFEVLELMADDDEIPDEDEMADGEW